MYDSQVNSHPISERVAALSGQIQDIADWSAQYRAKIVHTQLDRSANQMRELRLLQIKEELGEMLNRDI